MIAKPQITLLVTDLNNTLYDWVSFFVPAFYAMVDVAADILAVDREILLDELREVHQKYKNSEQPFALLEVKSVDRRYRGMSRGEKAKMLDRAFHAFNRERKERLRLYSDVRSSLLRIRSTGARLVAHTEARVTNSLFRVQALGLDHIIERLYAPWADGLAHPAGEKAGFLALERRLVTRLPAEHRKPDPHVLLDICENFGATKSETLYVGDSVARDVLMANRAGVWSAWAHYGGIYDATLWERLVRVTHWSRADVDRERALKEEAKAAKPDVELRAFSEILEYFEFSGPTGPRENDSKP